MSSRIYLKFPNDRWVLHLLLSLAPVELEGVTKVRQALKGLHILQFSVIDLPHVGTTERDRERQKEEDQRKRKKGRERRDREENEEERPQAN